MRWQALGRLAVLVVIYVLSGAIVFSYLESTEQTKEQVDLETSRVAFAARYGCVDADALEELLEKARSTSHQSTAGHWDLSNSIFFAVTLLTTIGYGNLAPSSELGRVFCVLYGIIGIPAVLALLAGLGGKGKVVAARLTSRVPFASPTQLLLAFGAVVFLLLPALVFSSIEGWTGAQGLYYAFITLATVGFGDLIAGMQEADVYPLWYRPLRLIWLLLGLAWLSVIVNLNKDIVRSFIRYQRRNSHQQSGSLPRYTQFDHGYSDEHFHSDSSMASDREVYATTEHYRELTRQSSEDRQSSTGDTHARVFKYRSQ